MLGEVETEMLVFVQGVGMFNSWRGPVSRQDDYMPACKERIPLGSQCH